ncbi:hypothetical protein ACMYR2_2566 [Nitrobacter sp. TKz-YC01]
MIAAACRKEHHAAARGVTNRVLLESHHKKLVRSLFLLLIPSKAKNLGFSRTGRRYRDGVNGQKTDGASVDRSASQWMQRTGMLRDFQVALTAAFALAAATSVAMAGLSQDRREDQPPQSRPKPPHTRQSNPPARGNLPAVGGFDGGWSFTGTSTNCQGSGGGSFTVSGTQVIVSGGGSGRVSRNGAFQASTNAGGGVRLSAVGRLSGNRGGGSYQRSDGCVGRWSAVRR